MKPNLRIEKKKRLLVEGAICRLACMQAQQGLRQSGVGSGLSQALPELLSQALKQQLPHLMLSILPLVLGRHRLVRWLRRGLLVAGGATAVITAIRRWRAEPESSAAHASTSQQDPIQP
jgi:hypothetical protein